MSEEIEIEDLIEKIFTESPKPQNCIELSFINDMDVKDLFEFLLTFFTEGSKMLFGDNNNRVDIAKWTDIEFNIMNRYCKSIGFNMIIERFCQEEKQLINFNKMSYKNIDINQSTPLAKLKLPLDCGENIFVFSFEFI